MEIQTIKELKNLIAVMEESSLTEIKIKNKDGEITLSSKQAAQPVISPSPVAALAPAEVVANTNSPLAAPAAPQESDDGEYITSPLVGTYYASASPDAASFVEVGTQVKKGDILCIIEAMKVMNEIQAEKSGVIKEILVSNAQLVDFNMKLFKIQSS